MGFVDADTHVHEPLRAFDYLEANERHLRPIPITTEDEARRELWLLGDQQIIRGSGMKLNNAGGDVEAGAKDLSDVSLRTRWMDKLDVDYQVVIPSVFLSTAIKRPELEVAVSRSYNRFMADVHRQSGGRLFWTIVPPLGDMTATLAEMEFGKKNGGCAVLLRALEKERSLQDPYFYPMYAKAQELDLAMAVHVGNSDPAFNALGGATMFNTVPVIAAFFNLLVSDLDKQFPKLRFGFLEASAAWVPFALQRAARKLYPDDPTAKLDGSIMQQKNLFLACMSEEDLPYITSHIGEDMLVLGTDFGHTDLGTEIEGHKQVNERGDIGASAKKKILSDNARRLYGFN